MRNLLVLISLVVFGSCQDKTLNTADADEVTSELVAPDLSSVEAMMAYAEKVDQQVNDVGKVIPSLSFSNDDESFQVNVFTLQNLPVKIEEHFMSNRDNVSGIRTFYLNQDTLVLVKELRDELFPDGSFQMRETQTFYERGKAVRTIERVAPYQEDLPYATFQDVNLRDISMANAKQILSTSGSYQTNYLGYLEAAGSTFLLLGDSAPNGFTTALLLEYRDPFVKMLLDQKEKYKGKRLQVEFETVSYEGVEYQAYRKGKVQE